MELPLTPPMPLSKDEEHLKLLATFHYVIAALVAFFACIPFIHVGIGIMMVSNPDFFNQGQQTAEPPPAWAGYLFIGIGGAFILMGWATAVCTFFSGRYLARRKKRMFSFVMAVVMCLFAPLGTILGVFTLLVLSRPSVQRLYEENR